MHDADALVDEPLTIWLAPPAPLFFRDDPRALCRVTWPPTSRTAKTAAAALAFLPNPPWFHPQLWVFNLKGAPMGWNDHVDFGLYEEIECLVAAGAFEEGTPTYGVAQKVIHEGYDLLSPNQRWLFDT